MGTVIEGSLGTAGPHKRARVGRRIDEDEAWDLVLALARTPGAPGPSLRAPAEVTPAAAELLDLCVPLCFRGDHIVGHLGQSLDGRVATPPGTSRLITGEEDVRHTHRLRALFDAVVVGATTVQVDDPQLTTRLVRGENPVRVVLDPTARLSPAHRIFVDRSAPTVVVTGAPFAARHRTFPSGVDFVELPLENGRLPLHRVVDALGRRGLRRLFVEGGGVTVSRFLDAGLLDRLHLTVAPTIVGTGEAAIHLSQGPRAVRPRETRRFLMGADVLFDFAFGPRE